MQNLYPMCHVGTEYLWRNKKMGYKRLNVRVSDDVYDDVKMWSSKLGLTMSQLGGMSVRAGMRYIIRAIDPIAGLTDDELKRLMTAFEERGLSETNV